MTRVERKLRALIAAKGPVPVAEFVRRALYDPEGGYYSAREPFGAAGDFVTAPEISQMFGELLGLWAADMWQRLECPDNLVLAEIGPGRGTLMADVLRAIGRAAPAMLAGRPAWLVETSPRLRAVQAKTLAGRTVEWAGRLGELPDGPLILLANEFLDALPVRQVVRRGDGFDERAVDVVDDAFAFVEAPLAFEVPEDMPALAEGEIFEISEEGRRFAEALGARLASCGGAALLIDYGHVESAAGDTLQALRQHRFHPVLAEPGTADITAHVDFAAIARAAVAGGARTFGPISQRELLRRLGIEARLAQLLGQADGPTGERVLAGYRRLTEPDRMGNLFKALCLAGPAPKEPTAYDREPTDSP